MAELALYVSHHDGYSQRDAYSACHVQHAVRSSGQPRDELYIPPLFSDLARQRRAWQADGLTQLCLAFSRPSAARTQRHQQLHSKV